jgi:hypothetical protein
MSVHIVVLYIVVPYIVVPYILRFRTYCGSVHYHFRHVVVRSLFCSLWLPAVHNQVGIIFRPYGRYFFLTIKRLFLLLTVSFGAGSSNSSDFQ